MQKRVSILTENSENSGRVRDLNCVHNWINLPGIVLLFGTMEQSEYSDNGLADVVDL